MNDRERIQQAERVKKFDALCEAEAEVQAAIDTIKSDSTGPFTMNASRVQSIDGITITFASGEVVSFAFEKIRGLHGWAVSNALSPLLTELRERIWKEKEKI